jgi:uncharacterized protein (DUF2132 family)
MTEPYTNNPLHGLKLEILLTELVDHYGWEILAAALNFNCFKLNPSIKGSLKFLRKTEWARHKLESFYLYRFKNLPRPDEKQFALPPRDRIIPDNQQPRAPAVLTLESLAKARERKEQAAQKSGGRQPGSQKPNHTNPRSQEPRSPRSPERTKSQQHQPSRGSGSSADNRKKPTDDTFDPWSEAKKRLADKNNSE